MTEREFLRAVTEQHGDNDLTWIILSKPIDRPAWFRRATEKSGCIHDGAVYDLQNCWNWL